MQMGNVEENTSQLKTRLKLAEDILKNEKGKTKASMAARLAARLEMAQIFDDADNAGVYLGQKWPTYAAKKHNESQEQDRLHRLASGNAEARHRAAALTRSFQN